MKPAENDTTVISNMSGREIAMAFDADSLAHLMSVMTNMYPDPEEAVIREYSCNAYDSQIEAGNPAPIEVITPSEFDPTLRIIDHGTGLNEHDIETVYALYGASTKRETNEQNGTYGIGAKSALSYTDQFTVIGIKEGVRTVVSVSRDEEGSGTMTIVEEHETDEPNGVEIIIPAQRRNGFHNKAKELFRYWPQGSVLLNGEEPDHLVGLALTDDIMLARKAGYEDSVVVMGTVPYEIPSEVAPFSDYNFNYRLVAKVDIGDVSITPARDSLQINRKTRERMQRLSADIQKALKTAPQTDINTATTAQEAMRKACAWRVALNARSREMVGDLTWDGTAIPIEFSVVEENEDSESIAQPITLATHEEGRLSTSSKAKRVSASAMVSGLVVYGYDKEKFTAGHKRKLMAYAAEHNLEVQNYILSQDTLDCRWIDAERVARWEEIQSIKIARVVGESGARKLLTGSYDVYKPGHSSSSEVLAKDIDASKPIYYFDKETFESTRYSRKIERTQENWEAAAELVWALKWDCTIVRLGLNRIAKFNRDFPWAKPLKDALEEHYNGLYDGLGEDVRNAWRLQEEDHILKKLDAREVVDPELQDAIRLAILKVNDKVQPLEHIRMHALTPFLDLKVKGLEEVQVYNLSEAYPLIADRYLEKEDYWHVYTYVNAIYEKKIATAHLQTGQVPERKAA